MARYTDEQAQAIKDRHSLALLNIPGVHGVGVQQDHAGNHRLVVLADTTAERSSLPSQIEGLPVSVEESGPFKPMSVSRSR
jgi:hypothetical protein